MKLKDPAFLMYSSDFLTGTYMMSKEERGEYITLMCLQHQKGRLSEEDIKRALGTVSEYVMENFELDSDGLFYNKRLEFEIEKRANHSKKQKENGLKGGRPKGSKNNPKDKRTKTKDKPNNNPNQTQSVSQTISQKKPLENENENEDVIVIINDLFTNYTTNKELISTLQEFSEMRIDKKKPLTERATKAMLKNLSKLGNTDEEKIMVLNNSISNDWSSLYELKTNKKAPKRSQSIQPEYSYQEETNDTEITEPVDLEEWYKSERQAINDE